MGRVTGIAQHLEGGGGGKHWRIEVPGVGEGHRHTHAAAGMEAVRGGQQREARLKRLSGCDRLIVGLQVGLVRQAKGIERRLAQFAVRRPQNAFSYIGGFARGIYLFQVGEHVQVRDIR